MSQTIAERLNQIRSNISTNVKLVAVSKYTTTEAIRAAYKAGIRDFGESRVQDAKIKQMELADLTDITWHMIGSLQSNKTRQAIAQFDWIQSLDRLRLAEQCDRLIQELGKSPKLLLQVKLAEDPHKSGWTESELLADLHQLEKLQNLNIVGLMSILPLGLNESQAYDVFSRVGELAAKLRSLGWSNIQELSMGMSADYAIAVKAGATMIRVGNQIFSGY
ncbi:MAG: YggS family pyridoxal phosphate-dependent enzyme [Pseudanabaena sp.]|uniref:YggS family pyridoxal phosphate-dependent enzyme n=1 Tax=Pseudanabaena mucicola TaxID=71190 RepID=UPI0033074B9A|nr:YggS family pyridoxal phosphate-dependent enzyme [Pseudanabaena sp. M53BS1SP1A06MG]MCA6582692.1 YggS family pyridoxal phosphate-dependent enzyme [Pseudanabaena sp. M34BS1SP1A06MG]MCA6586019.1 YggS family pyridoxal phosphate-dependent enzyme [Pseudanabaena sp. M051S1SP1A06QC]MCA6589752.1 YggS family pyridoxal phosphate-dependent enzyme [Pseudanabaena sp. M109S1SP1A06QC]MCA6592970.1 YggS family pyridoxal phosphate-dependent enzyme [Pseudanabaena sp. M38BS1SP1A06MG]MCA6598485.1 YggS family pyr